MSFDSVAWTFVFACQVFRSHQKQADLGLERNVMIAVPHKYRVHSEDLTMGPKKMMVQKKMLNLPISTMGSFKCPMLVLGGDIVNIELFKNIRTHSFPISTPTRPGDNVHLSLPISGANSAIDFGRRCFLRAAPPLPTNCNLASTHGLKNTKF